MTYFTRQRVLIWSIIALMAVNVSALATLIVQNVNDKSPDPHREGPPPGPRFIQRKLNLSPGQLSEFHKLRRSHQKKVQSTVRNMIITRKTMYGELNSEDPDRAKIDHLASDLGNLQSRLEKINMKHFLEVRSILNSRQQKKFLRMLQRLPMLRGKPSKKPGMLKPSLLNSTFNWKR